VPQSLIESEPLSNGRPCSPSLALRDIHVRVRPEELAARKIVEQYARTSLDALKLWPPKSYFFSRSGRCVIAYAVANNVAISLGDPVGPETEIEATTQKFLELCKDKRWSVAFYRTSVNFLPIYESLRLQKMKIGEDAIVNVSEFSLEGRSKRDIRSKARHYRQLGIEVVEYPPPLSPRILSELNVVEEQWLKAPGRRERTFAVGHFDKDYLRSTPVLAVVDRNQKILAFINVISTDQNEIAGDLIRRGGDAPNGIMDYLLLNLIHYACDRGYRRVSLGLAPMTGFKMGEPTTFEERAINGILRKFNFLFHFRSLYQYKAKFATSWEPRYLVYENLLRLPRMARALVHLSEIKSK
jgi:phosphatidylglycerol lysyltransferase